MIANMETIARTQMILRVPPQLLVQLKHNAKRENLSLNAYVEQQLTIIAQPSIPKLPNEFKVSDFVKSLSGVITAPTQEELEADPKLAYILEKGGV